MPPHTHTSTPAGEVGHCSSFEWVRVASGFPLGAPSKVGKVETMADHVGMDSDEEGPKLASLDLTQGLGQDRKGDRLSPKFGAESIPGPKAEGQGACPASQRRAGPEPPASQRPPPPCLPDRGRRDRPWAVLTGPPWGWAPASSGEEPSRSGRVTKGPTAGHLTSAKSGRPGGGRVGFGGAASVRGPCSPAGRSLEQGGEPVTGGCGRSVGLAQAQAG